MQTDAVFDKRLHHHPAPAGTPLAERATRWALGLTVITMAAEIVGGTVTGSMAVLADGWHMGSHAIALGISALAYALARRFSGSGRFPFGGWKIEVLGGYTSALLLVMVALGMAVQSVEKLLTPDVVLYDQAMMVAVVGLLVNLLCGWILSRPGAGHHHHDHHAHHGHHGHHNHHHHHDHDHDHPHSEGGHHHGTGDINLRSAYVHVMADAATSVLAIIALIGGKLWGLAWLDPLMGIVGAVLVLLWAWGLLRDAGSALLDTGDNSLLVEKLRQEISAVDGVAAIHDFHLWRVGADDRACAVSVGVRVGQGEHVVAAVHRQVAAIGLVSHLTVEVWAGGGDLPQNSV